ncbi:hypothetical protein ANCDUO_27544, partial [Ancylostoma duodenale]
MLTFIYTGAISPHELELEDASDVMVLAEKYNIPALKTMCEQDLISRVCAANVVDCMELADYHQASHLYEHCLDFMCSLRKRDVFKTTSQSLGLFGFHVVAHLSGDLRNECEQVRYTEYRVMVCAEREKSKAQQFYHGAHDPLGSQQLSASEEESIIVMKFKTFE